jgi:preprotein translocase subunit SecE
MGRLKGKQMSRTMLIVVIVVVLIVLFGGYSFL